MTLYPTLRCSREKQLKFIQTMKYSFEGKRLKLQ